MLSDTQTGIPVVNANIEERRAFLKKVYMNLVWSILVLSMGMYYIITSRARLIGVARHPILMIILFIAVFFWAQSVRLKEGINFIALLVFAFVNGIFLAPTIAFYLAGPGGGQVVFQAFGTTVFVFAGLTIYTMVSKKDFSFLGSFLFSGLIALIGAEFLSAIFGWGSASMPLAFVGAVIFSGLILFDTSRIMKTVSTKDYIGATLSLYLDFINLFLFLLQIFGGRRR